jgi:hypothetical protein
MAALPFDPRWLGDLSPLLVLGVAEQFAPGLDPAHRDEQEYDPTPPDSDYGFALGARLGRKFPREETSHVG